MVQSFSCSPAISVIVPTYNRLHILPIALESLVEQSFRDFEVLVVNDAGQDPADVVASFSDRLNIRLINHEHNKGIAAARNTGITAARGRYLSYLDDDDYYFKKHLAVLHDFLTNSNYMVAYTDSLQEWQTSDRKPVKSHVTYSVDFTPTAFCYANKVPVNCIMHERACIARSGCFAEYLRGHEDWDLWLRMSRHYEFAHLPIVTCVFTTRLDKSSLSFNKPIMRDTWIFVRQQGLLTAASPPVSELEQATALPGRLGLKNPSFCACSVILSFATLPHMLRDDLSAFCAAIGDAQLVLVASGFTRMQLLPLYEHLVNLLPTPPLVLNTEKEIGRIFAANLGASAATGEWLIFLDEDASFREGCLTALNAAAAACNPHIGALGPVLHLPGRAPIAGGIVGGGGNPVFAPLPKDAAKDTLLPVQLISGHCLMVRRNAFADLGGFDPYFAPGHFADADLCLRLAAKGFVCAINRRAELDGNNSAAPPRQSAAGLRSLRLCQDRWSISPDRPLQVALDRQFQFALRQKWALRSTLWPSDGEVPTVTLDIPPHLNDELKTMDV